VQGQEEDADEAEQGNSFKFCHYVHFVIKTYLRIIRKVIAFAWLAVIIPNGLWKNDDM
jgi:hypothetical protein